MGEKYLEITPGTREAKLLKNKDTMRGQDPISTEELTRETKMMLTKIGDMIESIDKVVGDEEVRVSIKNTISNMETLSVDMKEFMELAKDGNGTIGRLLKDDKIYNDIDDMILDIKKHPWKLLYRPKESKKR